MIFNKIRTGADDKGLLITGYIKFSNNPAKIRIEMLIPILNTIFLVNPVFSNLKI
ncbi:MAG: hypothetical protein QMD61_04810 [Methanobacterium sp.]|nr:hypothetical protein [Methanobacterium sp.]